MFIGRTDVEAEVPILWTPDVKSWLIWKDPDAGKDWSWEEKGTTEEKMVGLHYQLNGHESEQTPGDGEGQASLACCSPWGCKELDRTERLNWTELNWKSKEGTQLQPSTENSIKDLLSMAPPMRTRCRDARILQYLQINQCDPPC